MTQKIIRMNSSVTWQFEPYPAGEIVDNRRQAQQADHSYLDDEQPQATYLYAGIWQTEPCTLRYRQDKDEMCYVIEGSVTITNVNSGQQETFKAGDVFLLRRDFECEWNNHSRLTKYYMIVKPKK